MHNGNGNGKRWLLIGLLVLGGFWLVNDSYGDGYRDALVQSGQDAESAALPRRTRLPLGAADSRRHRLRRLAEGRVRSLRWSGWSLRERRSLWPARHAALWQRAMSGSDARAAAPDQGGSPVFRGPRAFFEEWHRQAHEEAARAQYPAPPAPTGAPGRGCRCPVIGAAQGGFTPTPPPTPPAPEYWASMAGAAEAAGNSNSAVTPPAAPDAQQGENPDAPRGTAGTAV